MLALSESLASRVIHSQTLDVTYVTVAPAFLRLYSKHPVHMRVWRTWITTH